MCVLVRNEAIFNHCKCINNTDDTSSINGEYYLRILPIHVDDEKEKEMSILILIIINKNIINIILQYCKTFISFLYNFLDM